MSWANAGLSVNPTNFSDYTKATSSPESVELAQVLFAQYLSILPTAAHIISSWDVMEIPGGNTHYYIVGGD